MAMEAFRLSFHMGTISCNDVEEAIRARKALHDFGAGIILGPTHGASRAGWRLRIERGRQTLLSPAR